jgi:hypothetical protein
MTEIYNARDGAAFVQFSDGAEPYYLGECVSVDSAPDPKQGKDPVFCFDRNRNYKQVGSNRTAPSLPSFTLMTLTQDAYNYMELIKSENCEFNLLLGLSKCYDKGVLSNQKRLWTYGGVLITDDPVANPVNRNSDSEIEHSYSLIANLGRADLRPLTFARIATTETAVLNDVTACPSRCASSCGARVQPCQNLAAAADTVAAAVPDVLISVDRALTWTSPASGFAAGESVKAAQCVELSGGTVRKIVVRDTDAGNPLEVNYSDDNFATNTLVVVGATAGEAAYGGGSLFALDAEHIWLCTDDGRVFFSDDAALTWTDQTTALAASGAAALRAIHFATDKVGAAVGAGDTIIVTVDGGVTWAAGTATGSGDGLNTVHVFDSNRLIVGTDSSASASPLYMSYDWTTNWTTITEGLDIAATDTVEDVTFLPDGRTGFLIKNTAAPVGHIYRSPDGGWTWIEVNVVDNDGLESIYACNENLAFTVGQVSAATSFIGQISG